jgi:hypothetical protein
LGEWKDVVVRGRTVRKYVADRRYDVLLKRMTTEIDSDRTRLRGFEPRYASAKRQLSHREKKNYGLL